MIRFTPIKCCHVRVPGIINFAISRFRDFAISRFRDFAISRFRDFAISRFRDFDFAIPRFRLRDFAIPVFTTRATPLHRATRRARKFSLQVVFGIRQLRVTRCSSLPLILTTSAACPTRNNTAAQTFSRGLPLLSVRQTSAGR